MAHLAFARASPSFSRTSSSPHQGPGGRAYFNHPQGSKINRFPNQTAIFSSHSQSCITIHKGPQCWGQGTMLQPDGVTPLELDYLLELCPSSPRNSLTQALPRMF